MPTYAIVLCVIFALLVIFAIIFAIYRTKKEARQPDEPTKEEKLEEEKFLELTEKKDFIEKTKIINTSTVKNSKEAFNRGVTGAILFGIPGAIIGSNSAKHLSLTTFLIIYKDGHRETDEVVNGSKFYEFSIQFLEA